MLTLFTVPKPFHGHSAVIQRNAIKSWMLLEPRPEIILLGNEEGTEDFCKEFGVIHIPQIERNTLGTPLVNSIFLNAKIRASRRIACYVNADIILMDDFIEAIKKIHQRLSRFLIISSRWNIDITKPLDFSEGWKEKLRAFVASQGKPYPNVGTDIFAFPKELFMDIPAFAVGRTIWDNWIIYKYRSQKVPVVDITPMATLNHQNHDYAHCKDGDCWRGKEAKKNFELAGGYGYVFVNFQATHKLTDKGLVHNISYRRLYYEINRFLRRTIARLMPYVSKSAGVPRL